MASSCSAERGRARYEEGVELPARLLRRWCYLFDSLGDPGTQEPLLLAPLVAAEETREGARVLFAERLDVGPKDRSVELVSPEGLVEPIALPLPWFAWTAALAAEVEANA